MSYRHNLIEGRYIPAGVDVAAVLRTGDERELQAVWDTYHHAGLLRETLDKLDAGLLDVKDPDTARAALHDDLGAVAAITPTQALEANRRLVDLLTGRRWSVMQAAREAGDSWTAIGDALGVSKQGARDWYLRKIEHQEKYVPQFHDAARARAALGGDDA
ncbi:hypothetical protein [Nocardia cyriacigeorgica]|uniref:hypothetical protein n=1 Tax=Nocardia cyriacigeorgica TaxID=135487 RepID=UPI0034DAC2E2